MIRRRVHKSDHVHPLEPLVREAFQRCRVLDETVLACWLLGGPGFAGRHAARGRRAYRIVAGDVLGYMKDQGKITQDDDGWYRLLAPVEVLS